MLASSQDAVFRAEPSLASAGITDGAILPGVYEGSGEQLVGLVGHGKVVSKVDFETSIRIELRANGRFFYTETRDGKTQKMKGDYVLTTAGVDFTPEGKNPFSIRVEQGVFQCLIGLGDYLSLKRVQ